MDDIPNEVFLMLVKRFDVQDLLTSRLVNSVWYEAATNILRRITNITFKNLEHLQAFNKSFSSTVRLPCTRFTFMPELLRDPSRVARSAIMDFGERHGEALSRLILDAYPTLTLRIPCGPSRSRNRSPSMGYYAKTVERNVQLLLEGKDNLEELTVKSWHEMGAIDLPTFPKLRTIKLIYFSKYGSAAASSTKFNSPSFHTELSQRIPAVESVTISDLRTKRLMTFLRNLSEKSCRAAVKLYFDLPVKATKLDQFMATPSPPIIKLKLFLDSVKEQVGEGECGRQVYRLIKAHAPCLRKLTLESATQIQTDNQEQKELPELPSLLELDLGDIYNFRKFTFDHFPRLRKLTMPGKAVCAFLGSVLTELKELSLDTSGQENDESEIDLGSGRVELMFPNVEFLDIRGPSIRTAFRLSNLLRLKITDPLYSGPLMWKIFTGEERFQGDVCTVPIPEVEEPQYTTETENYTVKNLKKLEILELENFDKKTARLLIYISRTRQLRRLKVLTFSERAEAPPNYLDELKLHHDLINIPKAVEEEEDSSDSDDQSSSS